MSNSTFAIYRIGGSHAKMIYEILNKYIASGRFANKTIHNGVVEDVFWYLGDIMTESIGEGYCSDEELREKNIRLDADGNLWLEFSYLDGCMGLHGFLLGHFPDMDIQVSWHDYDTDGNIFFHSSSPEVFPLEPTEEPSNCEYVTLVPRLSESPWNYLTAPEGITEIE